MIVPIRVFALHQLSDSENGRYALTAVKFERIEPGRVRAIACDGKVMGVCEFIESEAGEVQWTGPIPEFPISNDDAVDVLVPAALCRRVGETFPCKGRVYRKNSLLCEARLRQPDATHVEIAASLAAGQWAKLSDFVIEGKFPSWEQILRSVPPYNESTAIAVDARKLISLLTVACKVLGRGDDEPAPVHLRFPWSGDRMITISTSDNQGLKFAGALMPMSVEGSAPEWRPGAKDAETRGKEDAETRREGDAGKEDAETRREGDAEKGEVSHAGL